MDGEGCMGKGDECGPSARPGEVDVVVRLKEGDEDNQSFCRAKKEIG